MNDLEMPRLKPGIYPVVELDASFGHLKGNVEPELLAFAESDEGIGFINAMQFQIIRGEFDNIKIEVPESVSENPILRIPYKAGEEAIVYRRKYLPKIPKQGGEKWKIDQTADSISGSHARGLVKVD